MKKVVYTDRHTYTRARDIIQLFNRSIKNQIFTKIKYYFSTDFQRELHTAKYLDEVPHMQPTLDEITNKVFEELLVGKSRNKYQYSEGSCKVSITIFKEQSSIT